MTRANKELRELLKAKKIPQWEVAKAMGISEFTLCRRLREPLSDDDLERVNDAITQLEKERKVKNNE